MSPQRWERKNCYSTDSVIWQIHWWEYLSFAEQDIMQNKAALMLNWINFTMVVVILLLYKNWKRELQYRVLPYETWVWICTYIWEILFAIYFFAFQGRNFICPFRRNENKNICILQLLSDVWISRISLVLYDHTCEKFDLVSNPPTGKGIPCLCIMWPLWTYRCEILLSHTSNTDFGFHQF